MSYKPKTLIGHQTCPECDHPDAEIKTDRSSNPYRYCPMCNAQYFTRGDAVRVKNMIAKMRPVAAASPDVAIAAAPTAAAADPGPDFKPPKKPTAKKWFPTMMDPES